MSAKGFRVGVTKDNLVFHAAHFITFAGGLCERLHGHNWRTAVEVGIRALELFKLRILSFHETRYEFVGRQHSPRFAG